MLLFLGVYLGNSSVGWGQLRVSSSIIWTTSNLPTPTALAGGIIIENNATLTISGVTITFLPNSRIEVEDGSHLEVINSVLQSANIIYGNGWWGILASSSASIEQFNIIPDKSKPYTAAKWEGNLNVNKTSVIIKGNSIIRNCINGINSYGGSILRIFEQTIFDNCKIGVQIFPYKSILNPKVNACYIIGNRFQWNLMSHYTINYIPKGIFIEEIFGINIGGNTFINNDLNQGYHNERGTGIDILNSNVNISRSGDIFCDDEDGCLNNCYTNGSQSVGNTFENLSFGINYINTTIKRYIAIRNSNFKNVFKSIIIYNANSPLVANNNFENSDGYFGSIYFTPSPSAWQADINISNSEFLTIYKNTFDYSHARLSNCGTSTIIINNCGSMKSEIKKNVLKIIGPYWYTSFDGVYAIVINGSCSGLEITCNEFDFYGVDIMLKAGSTTSNFGTSALLSGYNIFSTPYVFTPQYKRTGIFAETTSTSGIYYFEGVTNRHEPETNITILANPTGRQPNCSMNCTDLLTVGFKDIFKNNKIESFVFPNPSNGKFEIKLSQNFKNANFKIINSIGQIVFDGIINSNQISTFDLSNFKKGIYFVILNVDNKSPISQKINLIN